jgi:hypothetical protein
MPVPARQCSLQIPTISRNIVPSAAMSGTFPVRRSGSLSINGSNIILRRIANTAAVWGHRRLFFLKVIERLQPPGYDCRDTDTLQTRTTFKYDIMFDHSSSDSRLFVLDSNRKLPCNVDHRDDRNDPPRRCCCRGVTEQYHPRRPFREPVSSCYTALVRGA